MSHFKRNAKKSRNATQKKAARRRQRGGPTSKRENKRPQKEKRIYTSTSIWEEEAGKQIYESFILNAKRKPTYAASNRRSSFEIYNQEENNVENKIIKVFRNFIKKKGGGDHGRQGRNIFAVMQKKKKTREE